jgi:hypothetical protein
MQPLEKKIMLIVRTQTRESGIDFFPVEIQDIQNSIGVDDVSMHTAVKNLVRNGFIELKTISGSMIQFTIKGKMFAENI